ncbi:MAG: Uma2 family endonuclease [Clostridiales bacterium]|jgi:Uma2 family endonuclease|nr:Uma2 family endonuclease [Clostridiales bacterium]
MALPAEKLEQRLTQPQHNLRLVPDIKWELIDGVPVMMSPGRPNHSRAGRSIFRKIDRLLTSNPKYSGCEVFKEDIIVKLDEGNRFIPDIAVFCNTSIIGEVIAEGPPDLIVEVLSPSTARNDRGHKMKVYGKTGVKEYWIVDPIGYIIEVYYNGGDEMNFVEEYAILSKLELSIKKQEGKAIPETSFNSLIFPELVVDLYEVFADVLPEDY